ncbi:cytochrome P450 6a2-like [Choristoneura fumiferana]|uniref:cytochrome P450 6a2-like n=1 Tax=Choristoneura fumiferana TaxID=7141 RepID=UPI003D154D40
MALVLILLALALFIYYYGTRNHDYWAKRNVKHDPPTFFFGNNFLGFVGKKSFTDVSLNMYDSFPNEKLVGYYRGATPELYIRDPEIVRNILTTDFAYFHRRGLGRDPDVEPLLLSIFHVDGDRWKLARQRLTPAFTTARLRGMFPLVVRCAEKLQRLAEDKARSGGPCDVRDLMARFTTDFIGACGFGVDIDSINNEHSAFRDIGKLVFARPLGVIVKSILWELFPILRSAIHVSDPRIEKSIIEFVKKIREEREFKPSGRNDFVDLLLELESNGTMIGPSIEHYHDDGSPVEVQLEMDIKLMAAQVFIFFAAGYETSSSTTSYTLHELAYNPEYQLKIQEEIDTVLRKYDNKLCYDAIAEMTWLNMAFKESMRIFPSVGVLTRVCARRYRFPDLDLTVDPGVKVVIPVQALQTDEQYFDNPLVFRPERFSPTEVGKQHKYTYLPFGDGPRACIGEFNFVQVYS